MRVGPAADCCPLPGPSALGCPASSQGASVHTAQGPLCGGSRIPGGARFLPRHLQGPDPVFLVARPSSLPLRLRPPQPGQPPHSLCPPRGFRLLHSCFWPWCKRRPASLLQSSPLFSSLKGAAEPPRLVPCGQHGRALRAPGSWAPFPLLESTSVLPPGKAQRTLPFTLRCATCSALAQGQRGPAAEGPLSVGAGLCAPAGQTGDESSGRGRCS